MISLQSAPFALGGLTERGWSDDETTVLFIINMRLVRQICRRLYVLSFSRDRQAVAEALSNEGGHCCNGRWKLLGCARLVLAMRGKFCRFGEASEARVGA